MRTLIISFGINSIERNDLEQLNGKTFNNAIDLHDAIDESIIYSDYFSLSLPEFITHINNETINTEDSWICYVYLTY